METLYEPGSLREEERARHRDHVRKVARGVIEDTNSRSGKTGLSPALHAIEAMEAAPFNVRVEP